MESNQEGDPGIKDLEERSNAMQKLLEKMNRKLDSVHDIGSSRCNTIGSDRAS